MTRPSKKAPTAEQLARYVVRTCRTMHGCVLCTGTIENGQQCHDGGLDRRAHVECVAGALWAPPNHEREAADILEELERDPGDPLGVWSISEGRPGNVSAPVDMSHAIEPSEQAAITEKQRRLRPMPIVPRTHAEYRRVARWWELEAQRGHASADASRRYARNMRWAAELAGLLGPGTWLELLERSGHPNPEAGGRSRKERAA